MTYKVLDLFSGIGGFSLGLERTGLYNTAMFVEYAEYQQQVLKKHWPLVPIHADIRTLTAADVPCKIDVVTGGFPCQPFSTAAHGHHTAIDFWPEMFRVIKEVKPDVVIAENVVQRAINKAQRDLKGLGCYDTASFKISAKDCGAPHRRNRWWLVAHTNVHSKFSSAVNAKAQELQKLCDGVWSAENLARALGVSDGVSNRMDRLKCLGNAVVPFIPQMLGQVIHDEHLLSH